MAGYTNVFKRYEKKYLLNQEQYEIIKNHLPEFMKQDEYGKYPICNLYYDTDHYDLIRRSIEKPVYKEKFRIRSYGVPQDNHNIYLEIKKKYSDIVYKRRLSMQVARAIAYLNAKFDKEPFADIHLDMFEGNVQILKEIDYFLEFYQPVPKEYIRYDRIAYYGIENPNLRLTIDTDIRYREYDLDLRAGEHGENLLKEGQYLMEIKIPDAMPLWMTKLLNEHKIYPTSFSKYGNVYKTLLAENKIIQGLLPEQSARISIENSQQQKRIQGGYVHV